MIIPLFLLTVLLGSCRFLTVDSIQLDLPACPQNLPSFPEDSRWTLEYLSGTGQSEAIEISYTGECSLSLDIPKEAFLVCLLHPPEISDYHTFHPAGGLFEPGENPSLDITWPGGAGAAFLIDAAEGGLQLSTINLRRLSDTILEKGDPDPWLLDWDLLGCQLAQREMRSWYVRKKYFYDLNILFPVGRWLSGSAWLDPFDLDVSVTLELGLCEGIHSFLNIDSGEIFIIIVDDKGEFFTLLSDQRDGCAGSSQLMGDCSFSSR